MLWLVWAHGAWAGGGQGGQAGGGQGAGAVAQPVAGVGPWSLDWYAGMLERRDRAPVAAPPPPEQLEGGSAGVHRCRAVVRSELRM